MHNNPAAEERTMEDKMNDVEEGAFTGLTGRFLAIHTR